MCCSCIVVLLIAWCVVVVTERGMGHSEESRLTSLLRRVSREDERDRRLAALKQLKEFISHSESKVVSDIDKIFHFCFLVNPIHFNLGFTCHSFTLLMPVIQIEAYQSVAMPHLKIYQWYGPCCEASLLKFKNASLHCWLTMTPLSRCCEGVFLHQGKGFCDHPL